MSVFYPHPKSSMAFEAFETVKQAAKVYKWRATKGDMTLIESKSIFISRREAEEAARDFVKEVRG